MDDLDVPHMDEAGLACFKANVTPATSLLEYGCGGSTVYAANVAGAQAIVSVDSDPAWLQKVHGNIGNRNNVHLTHADVGPTGDWGRPTDAAAIPKFFRYMATPWRAARLKQINPNLILIDGRFRVACFLFSLQAADAGSVILFDDYINRKHYHVVEAFCKRDSTHGRMGRFIVHKNYDDLELTTAIAAYSINPD